MDELETRVKELEDKKSVLTDKVTDFYKRLFIFFRELNQKIKLRLWKRDLKRGEIYLNKKELRKKNS